MVAVPDKDYKVKEHKGALKRVSPEELSTAFVLAVARDITRGEADEVLQKWKDIMLTTTCKFVLLNTPMDRYWAALKEREKISATFKACVRSCYQRLHEVMRLMDAMRQRMPESKVTTERVYEEYKRNLTNMHTTNEGAISHGFLKVALTVAKRMLAVPEIAEIMREADS